MNDNEYYEFTFFRSFPIIPTCSASKMCSNCPAPVYMLSHLFQTVQLSFRWCIFSQSLFTWECLPCACTCWYTYNAIRVLIGPKRRHVYSRLVLVYSVNKALFLVESHPSRSCGCGCGVAQELKWNQRTSSALVFYKT